MDRPRRTVTNRFTRLFLGIGMAFTLVGAPVSGSPVSTRPDAANTLQNETAFKFEVVSIRPSGKKEGGGIRVLPDGYQARVMSLEETILVAYFPAPYFKHRAELTGYPSWVGDEPYDIEAKLSPNDVASWQKLNQSMMQTSDVLQQTLRTLLAERCNLRIHSVNAQVDGYSLSLDRNALKLQPEPGDLPTAKGIQLPDGGKAIQSIENGVRVLTFYNTSMTSLASFLALTAQAQIDDQTGLKGRYRFVLRVPVLEEPSSDNGTPDQGPPIPWDLQPLGLKIHRAKVSAQRWVVDDIQRPSPN